MPLTTEEERTRESVALVREQPTTREQVTLLCYLVTNFMARMIEDKGLAPHVAEQAARDLAERVINRLWSN